MPQIQVKDANEAPQTIGYYSNTGQTTKSGSIPVTIASDQDPVSVAVSTASVVTLSTASSIGLIPGATVSLSTTQLAGLPTYNLQSLQLAELVSIDNKIPVLSTGALDYSASAQPIRTVPFDTWKAGFSEVGAGLQSPKMSLLSTGTGMTVSQSQGNLVIAMGTSTKTETLIQSTQSFKGGLTSRVKFIASQRIVNQMFGYWLADLVGNNIAYQADATGFNITLTIPSNPFTATNIGQSVNIGAISGTGTPGRYAITGVAGNNVTLSAIFQATWSRASTTATVTLIGGGGNEIIIGGTGAVTNSSDVTAITNSAVTVTGGTGTTFAFPCLNAGATSGTLTYQNTDQTFLANSSGTCTVWGWNNMHCLFRDATATTALFDTQRNGWGFLDTAATVNNTATNTVPQIQTDGYLVDLIDSTVASSTGNPFSSRATRIENIPDVTTPLYLFITARNFAVAPASATTLTISFAIVETVPNQKIYLAGVAPHAPSRGIQVQSIQGGTISTVSTVTAVTAANLNNPGTVADVASAALTTTTTTSALTPTFGISYEVNIPVTVVSGTSPTLDVVIQESDDSGTNWFDVYHFPRITATGMYRSPKLPLVGNRVRYVQTLGGTSPSFTRSVNRLQSSDTAPHFRQLIDRAISLTTLNATTSSLTIQQCRNVQLVVNIGAATTAPVFQLEGSDDAGATWYALGTTLTSVASSTVQATVTNVQSQLLRARVSIAGATVTAGYVLIKAF